MTTLSSPVLSAERLRAQRNRRRARYAVVLTLLGIAVLALWWITLMVGETTYSAGEVLRVLRGQTVPGASFTVGDLRLPRATAAVAAGIAFGIGGATFQTLLRNQLASPDIIGISAGASAAGVTAITFLHLSQTATSALALVASLAVALIIYLTSLKSGFSGTRLILIGIGFAALLQAWVNYALSQAAAWDLNTATRWITGSLNNMSWERGLPLLVVVAVVAPGMLVLSHALNLLALTDELAIGFGLRVNLSRVLLILGAVTLISVATAATGPIAFLAFMSGPIARWLVPRGFPVLAPAALVGAVLVLAADLAGQLFFGTRYPVGVITGVLGAPFLILVLIRSHR